MRLIALAATLITAALVLATPARAGSPHFVGTPTATASGATLTVTGKEAGLGDETQINVTASAQAACLNPGGNFPSAANKETFTASGTFPVQNGHADFSLTLTATFQPACSPPMTVVWGDVTVTDAANGLTATVPVTQ
jgi:hypothetical protein